MKESTITIRVTPEQKEALQVKAKTIGFSTSEYVRLLIINDLLLINGDTSKGEKTTMNGANTLVEDLRLLLLKHDVLFIKPINMDASIVREAQCLTMQNFEVKFEKEKNIK